MYGDGEGLENDRLNTNDSVVKNVIDEWYEKSLYSKSDVQNLLYDSYISKTAIYCNDRSTSEYDYIEIYFASMMREIIRFLCLHINVEILEVYCLMKMQVLKTNLPQVIL